MSAQNCAPASHKPHGVIHKGDNCFKHIVNKGSVSKPKDGDARGCYVLARLNEHSSPFESNYSFLS